MTLNLLPDSERLIRAYLAQVSEITAIVGTAISTEQPTSLPAPCLTFTRLVSPVAPLLPESMDVCRIQVDAWATDKATANTLARTARAALRACTNYTLATVGTLGGASIVSDIAWMPDVSRTPATPRYTLVIDVYARP